MNGKKSIAFSQRGVNTEFSQRAFPTAWHAGICTETRLNQSDQSSRLWVPAYERCPHHAQNISKNIKTNGCVMFCGCISSNLADSGIAWCWLSEQQKWDSPNLGWCHCNFLGKSQKTVERTRFSEKYGSSKISLKASRDCSWMPLPMVGSVGSVGSPGISMV